MNVVKRVNWANSTLVRKVKSRTDRWLLMGNDDKNEGSKLGFVQNISP